MLWTLKLCLGEDDASKKPHTAEQKSTPGPPGTREFRQVTTECIPYRVMDLTRSATKKEKNTKLPKSREISYIQRVWRWPCLFAACVYLPALADMLTEGIGLGGKRSEPSDKQRRRFQNSNEPSRKWVLPNRSFPLWDRNPDSERNAALNVCVASFLWHAGGCDREKKSFVSVRVHNSLQWML